MKDINLKPQTDTVDQSVAKRTNALATSIKVMVSVLFIASFTVAAIYAIIYYRLKEVRSDIAVLRQELSNLQKTEQQLVLVKDRLGKITQIQSKYEINNEINTARDLIAKAAESSRIVGIRISASSVEADVNLDSSLNMTKLLSGLVGNSDYSRIVMKSFVYDPENAYRMKLEIIK